MRLDKPIRGIMIKVQAASGTNIQAPSDSRGFCFLGRCKGGEEIGFARYVFEAHAIEVLTAMQRELPDAFHKKGGMPESSKSYIARLGLSCSGFGSDSSLNIRGQNLLRLFLRFPQRSPILHSFCTTQH
jgi:hypothetical protein